MPRQDRGWRPRFMTGRFDDEPPYAFVPGGPFPHPIGSPEGHMAGRSEPKPGPIEGDEWERSPSYLGGFRLFNAGYYWEAHEAWEGLWHAHGRRGPVAELLKGLIKLAACGVKLRQGQRHGVVTHATRAAESFTRVGTSHGGRFLGLDMDELIEFAREILSRPHDGPIASGERVARVFDREIRPKRA